MADEQGNQATAPTVDQLNSAAAEFLGLGQVPQEQPEVESQPAESQGQESAEPSEPQTTNTAPEGQAVALPPELTQALESTPFKGENVVESVKKLVDSYKELQGTFTKERETVKPYEQLLKLAQTRPEVAQALRFLEQGIQNPKLLESYQNAPAQDLMPNPANYDIYTPEGLQKYQQDMSGYMQRQVDSRISANLSSIQEQQTRERQKMEFRQKFPDFTGDPDGILNDIMQRAQSYNPYEVAYKMANWDNREASLVQKIRKETTEKIQTASSATPQASTSQSGKTTPREIQEYIMKNSYSGAIKKFGEERVRNALGAI